eukprot:CAMPEP_0177774170 /NCGR_PEP_ID=MMETSP0491_2-20121128/13332_1 /TAXON_ID=63592 /ORGANISM="Tetraselmis chuii, Strain PLY429" /LENGTH=293 /DNA_ID=CAMNT_0019292467 /DNA_START=164 /DNA_END=1045 /DNA_ORIENTATION=+
MALLESPIAWQGMDDAVVAVDRLLAMEGPLWMYTVFAALVMAAMELLAALVPLIGTLTLAIQGRKGSPGIAVRGKHLDAFGATDYAFMAFNRLTTPLFTFHALQYLWLSPHILRSARDATALSTAAALLALFVVYDLTYCLFHRALHHRSVYRHVHKHHHRQMAPSRGNTDAVNVHPFEYLPGEYNHLFAIWVVSRLMPLHAATALFFIVSGGVLASLNHTRLDIKSPLLTTVYQVKYHDIHHWDPSVNFGQYTMLWDHVFRSFRAYPGEGGKEAVWAKVRPPPPQSTDSKDE